MEMDHRRPVSEYCCKYRLYNGYAGSCSTLLLVGIPSQLTAAFPQVQRHEATGLKCKVADSAWAELGKGASSALSMISR